MVPAPQTQIELIIFSLIEVYKDRNCACDEGGKEREIRCQTEIDPLSEYHCAAKRHEPNEIL
jgi:hypothetical protein